MRGEVAFRTLVGAPGSDGAFTAGVSEMPPGGWLGHHRHEPAELYYVVAGEGVVTIDGEDHTVTAGTALEVPGDAEHGVRNPGPGTLVVFYAFAVSSFDEVEYRFTEQG